MKKKKRETSWHAVPPLLQVLKVYLRLCYLFVLCRLIWLPLCKFSMLCKCGAHVSCPRSSACHWSPQNINSCEVHSMTNVVWNEYCRTVLLCMCLYVATQFWEHHQQASVTCKIYRHPHCHTSLTNLARCLETRRHLPPTNETEPPSPWATAHEEGEVTKWKWSACGKEAFKLIHWLSSLIDR